MSDVFISYARADQPLAQALATALQSMGWSVWWDRRIPLGSEFSVVIEQELTAARCVIVLWSKQSIASTYVRDEAGAANARGVLIPARIEDVQPPLGFRQSQTADLLDWSGDAPNPGFEKIIEAIERFTGAQAAREPVFGGRLRMRRPRWVWAVGVASVGIVSFASYYVIANYERLFAPPVESSEMVLLPGGEFMMGSTEDEATDALGPTLPPRWAEREQPRHRVRLDAFHLDKFEVTVEQFRQFLASQPQQAQTAAGLDAAAENHPVTGVTWVDAGRYCAWANKQLPSEAQWEYAARGGEAREYPWDKGPVNGLRANFCDRSCEGSASGEDDGFSATAPVGSFEAGKSGHGVYDLAGNAAEWVTDAYDPRFYERPETVNPVNDEPHQERFRVVRGGSYADEPYFLRAATRNFRAEDARDPKIGFRCARSGTARK